MPWALVDEPIVNKHIAAIEELDEIIGQGCAALAKEREPIKNRAVFHGGEKIANANLSITGSSRARSPSVMSLENGRHRLRKSCDAPWSASQIDLRCSAIPRLIQPWRAKQTFGPRS